MDKLDFGINLTPLKRIENPNGDIMHGLKKTETSFKSFGEAYFSFISKGAIKGWKKHKEMTLNLIVPIGNIRFVIYPSNEFGTPDLLKKPLEAIIGIDNYYRLTIPPGLWVAFQGINSKENMLLNIASCEHSPEESESIDLSLVQFTW